MHPAPSVIAFTTFSGLGFGMLFWLGLGLPAPTGWTGFGFFFIAYALAVGGLMASTFHLGHPERALKAFTQWRSSWLSREGIAAVVTLLVMGLYAIGLIFLDIHWPPLGWIGALGALATVFTTSMIYAQLRTVPRWHHWTVPPLFLSLSVGGGALLTGNRAAALVLLIVAAVLTLAHWARGDRQLAQSGTDMATATGLGHIGTVRAFEPPHTGTNYLLREFVFVVGRKHAFVLRIVAFALAFAVPLAIVIVGLTHLAAILAVAIHAIGVLVLRWLFFAQAEHVVGLYYGKR